MLAVIYFLLLLIVVLVSYVKFHRILNITSVFSGIWFVFGFLSCFGPYGLRKPQLEIHLYVWVFVLIVDLLFWIFAKEDSQTQTQEFGRFKMDACRGRTVQLVAIVLVIPMAVQLLPVLMQTGSMTAVRRAYFGGTLFNSAYTATLFRTIPMALLNAMIMYDVLYAFEKKEYKYLLYAMLNTVLVTIINGGRYAIIMLVYSILIVWITGTADNGKKEIFQKIKKKAKKLGIVTVIALVVVTVLRGQNILKSTICYFAGSLSFLDVIVENPSLFALDQPLYGYLTFGAILEPIVLVLKTLGITTAKIPSYEFNIYCQQYYNVGDGVTIVMNANTSILYYFLRDYGTIGVAIGAFLIGSLSVVAYNRWRKGSKFWGLMFCYMGNVLFNSLMTYQFFGQVPIFIILAFWWCTNGEKSARITANMR